mmetsp:Transcript_8/g.9  ORF Transcript_8/g.9 Transcript_8/m.9 type:complete len:112 (+) Transcript_8:189-524(+)
MYRSCDDNLVGLKSRNNSTLESYAIHLCSNYDATCRFRCGKLNNVFTQLYSMISPFIISGVEIVGVMISLIIFFFFNDEEGRKSHVMPSGYLIGDIVYSKVERNVPHILTL